MGLKDGGESSRDREKCVENKERERSLEKEVEV